MASVMMLNRGGLGHAGMDMPMPSASPAAMPAMSGAMVVPRCTMRLEKCPAG